MLAPRPSLRVGRPSVAGQFGVFVLMLLAAAALFGPLVTEPPINQDLDERFVTFATSHPFGTDQFGRDVLSRVLSATRGSLIVGIAVGLIAGVGGGLLGIVSGYFGGKVDLVLQRGVDALMALPLLVLALAVLVAVPASRTGVVVALSVGFTPLILRTTRASALAIKESGFVESANAVGASDAGIIWRHILPNVAGPWIIVVGAGVGTAILAESALSFLGLGAPISNPTLGSLLGGDAQNYIHRAPWLVLWPGVVISVLVLSVNLVAESYAESSATMRSRIASPGSGK